MRTPCDFPPTVGRLPHPAAPLLEQFRNTGVAVPLQGQWTQDDNDQAIKRGPHASAHLHTKFLREEFASMADKGQWFVLPYALVRDLPELRISPMGCVEQRDRRPRTIVDYTWSGVNDDTIKTAPPEAMQFGKALPRLVSAIVNANPAAGPVYMMKVDVADGFYRNWLKTEDIPKLAVAFPTKPGEDPLVAFPTVLPMGWVESPPHFCVGTETVADLANKQLRDRRPLPWVHRLDADADTPPADEFLRCPPPTTVVVPPHSNPMGCDKFLSCPPPTTVVVTPHSNLMGCDKFLRCPPPTTVVVPPHSNLPSSPSLHTTRQGLEPMPPAASACAARPKPLASFDVYVDDFIGLAQGSQRRLRGYRRVLLSTLDRVLRPQDMALDGPFRQEPASVKKFRKGDAYWSTRKIVLGWLFDTIAGTLSLPAHRLERLQELLASLPATRKRVSVKQWHKVLGELRSMSLALPGTRGLFSLLQEAFRHRDGAHRLKLSQHAHDFLDDFRWLIQDLGNRPTQFTELVPTDDFAVGACDAAAAGMGGVWFPPPSTGDIGRPVLWRSPFPSNIQAQLVTYDNPAGRITNSDLELAATTAHLDIAANRWPVATRSLSVLSDNTPAVAWQQKGSTTTARAAAYLLRLQALHQRHFKYLTHVSHIPGTVNRMADDASRLQHLSDSALLDHFNTHYPQDQSWKLCHLRQPMNSALTSALSAKRPMPASFLPAVMPCNDPGHPGSTTAPPCGSIPFSKTPIRKAAFSSSKYLPHVGATEDLPPAVNRSDLERWRMPFATWARRSPYWGPPTPAATHSARLTSASTDSSANTAAKIPHPRE